MKEDNYPVERIGECVHDRILSYTDAANGLADQVNLLAAQMNSAMDKTERLASMYRDCKLVEAQTDQVKAWSDVQITQTIAKYKTCQETLSKAFGEREDALNKYYSVLDNAIASNDRGLIIETLRCIGGIVTKSPLEEIQRMLAIYDDKSQPLLDF